MRYLILLSLLVLSGCDNPAVDPDKIQYRPDQYLYTECPARSYGNGVYYFPCTSYKFGNGLSAFLASNPTLKIEGITGDGTDAYGADRGYFVIARERK